MIDDLVRQGLIKQLPVDRKTRATRTTKGIFGLLPDWKIDTQELKDELRD
ncbi:hypothetical protein [Methanoregula sp.]|jgi:hypothetical protein